MGTIENDERVKAFREALERELEHIFGRGVAALSVVVEVAGKLHGEALGEAQVENERLKAEIDLLGARGEAFMIDRTRLSEELEQVKRERGAEVASVKDETKRFLAEVDRRWESECSKLESQVRRMREALELVILCFKRTQNAGGWLGDDEHEAWTAATKAIQDPDSPPAPSPVAVDEICKCPHCTSTACECSVCAGTPEKETKR